MAKSLFAIIRNEDKNKLFEILKNGEEHLKKRVQALIFSGIYKYKVSEISKFINLHPNHLRKWIKRYNLYGLDAILTSPKTGKKKKFGENLKKKIIEIASMPPRNLGLLFSKWTLHKLKNYVEEKGIVEKISHETIRKILKETNINLGKVNYEEI
ncbi:MAG: helix-turn-helix domain containing protein [Candidatus Omnitrophica bacterium]|nr:helix-turn-helix domain containing protein [Candidatus Omnitrophota bacterium]MCM8807136.1 helix-turn-helix domain containing protein [Candidatus Omnitrophota bacterium]